MRLNKSTSHAVRILIDCAKAEGRLIKVAEISERLDITQQNAFKIVHLLSKAGFLSSVRGRHGGVRLARPAAKIRIGDVVRSIETLGQEEQKSRGAAACIRSSTTRSMPSSASSISTRWKIWPAPSRRRQAATPAAAPARPRPAALRPAAARAPSSRPRFGRLVNAKPVSGRTAPSRPHR